MTLVTRNWILGSTLATALAGCTVGPRYTPPAPKVAPAFTEASSAADDKAGSKPVPGAEAVRDWWSTFHDAELDSLIRRAVAGNPDLKIAASRVRQAREERGITAAGVWPNLNVSGGYNRGRGSKNVQIPLGGSTAPASNGGGTKAAGAASPQIAAEAKPQAETGSGASAPAPSGRSSGGGQPAGPASPFGEGGLPGVTTSLYQVGFDATWEIDLFGGTRRALEAAGAQIDAAEEARHGVLVSLLAEVADIYVQLRSAQHRLDLAQQNLAAQRQILQVVQARAKAGFITELDVARQEAQVATTEAALPTQVAAVRTAIHALSVLIGDEPNALASELENPTALPAVPPEVPVGVPSDLLRRRPDIRRAERQLDAATAQVGVATADLFPRFSLTGALGHDSSQFRDLGDKSSRYYSIIPGVSWPILDWGRARAAVRVQNEVQAQALTNYEATVRQALKDVEDALVRYQTEQTRRDTLASAVDANRRAFTIAQQQYGHGIVDTTVVLEAQRSLLASDDALAQSDAAIRSHLISLYKALGGGWEPESGKLE